MLSGFGSTAALYEKALRKRKVWVEPLFAEAKDWHGMRRFRLRRLEKVNIEALSIASGQNAKRLLDFGSRRPTKSWLRRQPFSYQSPLAMRVVALGRIVGAALGGQRRHFSHQCPMALAGPPRSHENGSVALS
jgi:hypothetical protein